MPQQKFITFPLFAQFPEVMQSVSTRAYGSIKLKGVISPDNLREFLLDLTTKQVNIVFAKQVHGKDVALVTNANQQIITDKDGLITREKNILIGMSTADCLPIIFYDKAKKILGVVHAGYKGLLVGIIQELVRKMKELGSQPEDIYVGIGPAIGVCCYDVWLERIKEFEERYLYEQMYEKREGKYFLDLKRIAVLILQECGIKEEQIEVLPYCTKCNLDLFFSYRGDSKETYGENTTVIGLL